MKKVIRFIGVFLLVCGLSANADNSENLTGALATTIGLLTAGALCLYAVERKKRSYK